MYRQELQSHQTHASSSYAEDRGEPRHAPKTLPSGSQLPGCWNEAMDREICRMEAQNEGSVDTMIKKLKETFKEQLRARAILPDAIERRIKTLDMAPNDYFQLGMQNAVAIAETSGLVLPPYDPHNYPSKHYPKKSDEEVFGSGGPPMTGKTAFGASKVSEAANITRGSSKPKAAGRSKVPERKNIQSQTPVKHGSAHSEMVDRSRQLEEDLVDVTNTYNRPEVQGPHSRHRDQTLQQLPSSRYEKDAINPLPSTPVHLQSAPNFSTPRSRDGNTGRGNAQYTHGGHNYSTPTSRDRSRTKPEFDRAPTTSSSAGGLYISGVENATSGTSTSTTSTSMLGKGTPGMSDALERRKRRIDDRVTAND